MEGKVVNLRQARKRKARDAARAEGDRNAAAHGIPKAARDLARARAEKAERDLSGHEVDRDA